MHATSWDEHEMYQLTMDLPLSDLHGVGSISLRVFNKAGFSKIGDLYSRLNQEAAVHAAAEELAVLDGTADTDRWRALATYCVDIIRSVRSAEAQPFVPEHFLCPITYTCMEDPVVTQHGHSYERYAIERVANHPDPDQRIDPLARMPIAADDLIPNKALKEAIEFYQARSLRFSLPFCRKDV
jgi:hypothetical protein